MTFKLSDVADNLHAYRASFKTPADYWMDVCHQSKEGIDGAKKFIDENPHWQMEDCDLHVYPFTEAQPGILSMGCLRRCSFCDTAFHHKGQITYGDYNSILTSYKGKAVHWMDEDFFSHPEIEDVLKLLRSNNIKWTCMATSSSAQNVIDKFGSAYLHQCGLVAIEVGLENVRLFRKVKGNGLSGCGDLVVIYLRMCFLPGETSETIWETSQWFLYNNQCHRNLRLIHFSNGRWFCPGQYLLPSHRDKSFLKDNSDALFLSDTPREKARQHPTFVPLSFAEQKIISVDMEKANHYNQLVNGFSLFPVIKSGMSFRDFIEGDVRFSIPKSVQCFEYARTEWLAVACSCGAMVAK